ncbi:hypothetical protein AKO1_007306 [Acrasis kona]|uniref:Uncharacterized protein n=1 Tax=Acrasis kona TaxID=1008807 RepID=A0AAW2YUV4_9EUKA
MNQTRNDDLTTVYAQETTIIDQIQPTYQQVTTEFNNEYCDIEQDETSLEDLMHYSQEFPADTTQQQLYTTTTTDIVPNVDFCAQPAMDVIPVDLQPPLFATSITESTPVDPELLHFVTCGGRSRIFGLNLKNELFHLVKNNRGMEWEQMVTSAPVLGVSCRKHTLMTATPLGIYRLDLLQKKEAQLVIKDDRFVDVAALSKRRMYLLSRDGSVYHAQIHRLSSGVDIKQIKGPAMRKISAGGKHKVRQIELWAIGTDGNTYRCSHDKSWSQVDASLEDVSITLDNTIYGVDANGVLVKWDGRYFSALPLRENPELRLCGIAVNKEKQLYGIDRTTRMIMRVDQ